VNSGLSLGSGSRFDIQFAQKKCLARPLSLFDHPEKRPSQIDSIGQFLSSLLTAVLSPRHEITHITIIL